MTLIRKKFYQGMPEELKYFISKHEIYACVRWS